MAMSGTGFAALKEQKYLNLETFRKNGDGVRTPLWFAANPSANLDSRAAKLYIYTIDNTGKVKRIRNDSHVKVAPCDMRGNLLGEWVDARAEIVTGEEAVHGMRLLNKKYWPWKQILGLFALFSRGQRIVLALHLV